MTKIPMTKTLVFKSPVNNWLSCDRFEHWKIWISNLFRISCFGFRIYLRSKTPETVEPFQFSLVEPVDS